MNGRICSECGGEIPPGRSTRSGTCSHRCLLDARYLRTAENRERAASGSGSAARLALLKKIQERRAALRKKPLPVEGSARVCHDCGKPTTDYRCAACRDAWRKKYDVAASVSDCDAEW